MPKARVLIVEDEALLAMSMEADLEDRGFEITGVAATAEDAVALARATRPDVVLMDVRLKGQGDGVDAAQTIYAEELGARVIFVTGSREPQTVTRIQDDHPAALLIKPVAPDKIEDAIMAVLS